MAALTRDAILQADDLPCKPVPVPEWGGEVWVRGMTAQEKDEYESSILELKGTGTKTKISANLINARAKLVVKCALDEQGERLFKDEDAEALGKKSGKAVSLVSEEIQKLSGMGRDKEAELGKDSENDQEGGSSSG